MPVLPLDELGGRLRRRTKGGAKMTKEGCKTYQKLPTKGAKLIKTDQRGVQIEIMRRFLGKQMVYNLYGKKYPIEKKKKKSKVSYFYGKRCKMYQKLSKRGAKLIKIDQRGVQI